MAINQVLLEGALLGDPQAASGKGNHAHFELLDEEGHVFPCLMWLRYACRCLPGDRVLALGHLHRAGGEFLIDVISLRKLAPEPRRSVEPLRDIPEPVPGRDEIPI